ncbi:MULTISPECIES: TonB-dependent receptor domain-containing protein [Sphingomonas]|uniref:TonB-dependent receptor domain-containing protein n=1 Tax=Sphingomonas TaxID=13687 RepID=UPI0013B35F90|nr:MULTISPECIES: TonB-dependent receptor [Sphingomonas]
MTLSARQLLFSSISVVATLAAAPAFAQTASPQSTSDRCPDGSIPAPGVSCPPGGTDSQGAGTAPATSTVTRPPENGTVANDDVVVTGSRIARRGIETASPIEVIDSKQLDARGYQTVAQALNELPTFGVPGASPVGASQSGFGAGQSFVDFLGLGSQRTLTLVNGRRFVSSNTSSIFGPTGAGGSQVDLNVIPTKLIDRVETVAAIGAPIYGSDAIAGTINIILKKNYQGLDIDAQSGISQRGDAPDYRIRFLAGQNFGNGRGNITVAGEYNVSKGLLATDRGVTALDNRFDQSRSGTGPQVIYNDFRITSVDPNGAPVVGGGPFGLDFPLSPQVATLVGGDFNVRNAAGQSVRFDSNGNLIPIDFGGVIGPDDGFNVFTSGGNGFSLQSVSNLLTDLKRYNINTELSYQLTDNIRLFGEGWYSVSKGKNLAAQPVYNTGLFDAAGTRDGNLIIPLSNPFLSAAARTAIANSIANNEFSDQNLGIVDNQDYFYLSRASTDLSSGVSVGKSQVFRVVGGIDGDLHVLAAKPWKFEAFANYGRATVNSRNPELNQQNFLNALNSTVDANGNIVCAPYANSPVATISGTCVPFNPFGQQNSQAVKDYITTIATPRNLNKQLDFVASISGGLFSLPGGDLGFAAGFEHRQESSSFDPGVFYYGSGTGDSSQRGSYGRSVPIDPVFGKYHTNEIFGELKADIISPANHVPGVYALTVQTAGRYIWNSLAGSDPTYTGQIRYAPIRDIAFRGAYTRAVRAPSVTEAFNPRSSAFGFATDVCDQTLRNQGPDPTTRAANCTAAGLPANFRSLSNQRSFPTFTFGNPDLTNEKSDSITAGAVITPRFLPGFNATVDYVSVKLKNAISQFSNSQVVAACYDSTTYPNNPFCALLSRDASGQLNSVGTSYFNSAQLRYKGVIASIDYRRPTPFLGAGSRVGVNVSYQYLDTLTNQANAGDAPTIIDDSVGYSRHKGILGLSYDTRAFSGQLQFNYVGKAKIDPNASADFYSVSTVRPFIFTNLSLAYNVGTRFTFRGSVDNLFDVKPPYPYPASGGTSTYFQGILGRYYRVGAAVHF